MDFGSFDYYSKTNPLLKLLVVNLNAFGMFDLSIKMLSRNQVHSNPVPSSSSLVHIKLVMHSIMRFLKIIKGKGFPLVFDEIVAGSDQELEYVCLVCALFHDHARLFGGGMAFLSNYLDRIFEQVDEVKKDKMRMFVWYVLNDLVVSKSMVCGEAFLIGLAELIDVGVAKMDTHNGGFCYKRSAMRNVLNVRILEGEETPILIEVQARNKDLYFTEEVLKKYISEYNMQRYVSAISK